MCDARLIFKGGTLLRLCYFDDFRYSADLYFSAVDELVTSRKRIALQRRWPDLLDDATIDGYTLEEVSAEKVRCIAEHLQCRDLFDMHELVVGGHVDPLDAWHLYLRKAENDEGRGRQRTPPRERSAMFDRRLAAYRDRWDGELGDYLPGDVPHFDEVKRRTRRHLAPLLDAAPQLAE